MKTFKIVGDDISDGYHTFTELYDHRCALFIALCLTYPELCAFKVDVDFGDWICVYMETDKGQISYHVPVSYRDILIKGGVRQDQNYKWDGHTSADVLERLKP